MATRKQELERLSKLMEKVDIAMLTTVGAGGHLVSRPLSTQAASFDGEHVWFLTELDTPKVAELRRNGKVNVAWASKDANTYISASGTATVSRDRALVDRFWNDALKAFFPGGPEDPNLGTIEVRLRTVEYWDGPGSWIGKAVTFAIARITGNDDVMGENRIVDVATGRSRKPAGSDRPGPGARRKQAGRSPAKKSSARKSPAKKAAAKKAPAKTTRKAAKKTVRKTAAATRKRTATRKQPTR